MNPAGALGYLKRTSGLDNPRILARGGAGTPSAERERERERERAEDREGARALRELDEWSPRKRRKRQRKIFWQRGDLG